MMVLTRRPAMGESIVLRDTVTGELLGNIEVLSRKGNKIKLGVEAPRSVTIHRNEVDDRNTITAEHAGKDTDDDADCTTTATT